jgi:hypothetical protein
VIELADVISQLRTELDDARTRASDAELRFELGPIELEVTVALEKEAGAEAKIRFWVVELGADGTVTGTSTQRIKLTLNPVLAPDPAHPEHRPGTPFVSGGRVAGEQ